MKRTVILLILLLVAQLSGCDMDIRSNNEENSEDRPFASEEDDKVDSIDEIEEAEGVEIKDSEISLKLNLQSNMNTVTVGDSYFFNSEYYAEERIIYGIFEYNAELDQMFFINNLYGKNLNVINDFLYYVENTDRTTANTIFKSEINSLKDKDLPANTEFKSEIVRRFRGVDNLTISGCFAYFIEGYITSPSNKKLYSLNLNTDELVEIIPDSNIKDFQLIGNNIYVLVSDNDKCEILEIDPTSLTSQASIQFEQVFSTFAYIDENEIILEGQNFVIYNLVSNESYIIETDQIIVNYNIMDNKLIYTIRVDNNSKKSLVSKTLDLSSKEVRTLENSYIDFSVLDDKLFAYLVTEDRNENIYTEELVILNEEFQIIQYINNHLIEQ